MLSFYRTGVVRQSLHVLLQITQMTIWLTDWLFPLIFNPLSCHRKYHSCIIISHHEAQDGLLLMLYAISHSKSLVVSNLLGRWSSSLSVPVACFMDKQQRFSESYICIMFPLIFSWCSDADIFIHCYSRCHFDSNKYILCTLLFSSINPQCN